MTGNYIDRHFGDITGKSSVIESRQTIQTVLLPA